MGTFFLLIEHVAPSDGVRVVLQDVWDGCRRGGVQCGREYIESRSNYQPFTGGFSELGDFLKGLARWRGDKREECEELVMRFCEDGPPLSRRLFLQL
jgi:hypothetical protein